MNKHDLNKYYLYNDFIYERGKKKRKEIIKYRKGRKS